MIIAKLKTVLRAHRLPYLSCRDELILRVFMLKNGCANEAALREKNQLKDLVKLAKKLIAKLQLMHLTEHVYMLQSENTTLNVNKTFIPMPLHISGEDDLSHLFDPLVEYINTLGHNVMPAHISTSSEQHHDDA